MNNTYNRTTIQQNHEHEQVMDNNNNINSYSYYYLDTEPGVREKAVRQLNADRDVIIQFYYDSLGLRLTNVVANMFIDFIASGHTVTQLLDAIERTAFAPRPSPAYLKKVLCNYDSYGHYNPETFLPF